jgi:glycerol transport system ATP-binding protein
MLRLQAIEKQVGASTHLYPVDLELVSGSINVLLGATLAGKTTLLRLMAGLERPSSGRLFVDGKDLTGVPVRQRNLAMVYQQFINYPSLSVYDNIASPLQIKRMASNEIKRRVTEVAELLRLTPYLDRLPTQLSGGQQQRTALARALAKDAELLLLDEPLVNLDYKLREELRNELSQLFRNRATTVVYATTEPNEALQLGGATAVLDEGRVLQFGKTYDVFSRPNSLSVARAFSDPPINTIDPSLIAVKLNPATRAIALRAHDLHTERSATFDQELGGIVELAEISGSDTYLHVKRDRLSLVAQLPGVHKFEIGAPCSLFFNIKDAYGFDDAGSPVFAPEKT